MKYSTKSKIVILFLLLCLATLLRLINLGELDIGGDESFSVYIAQLTPSQIIAYLSTGDNPPLWELILHYWIKLFGIGEFSVRVPSLIFNVLTIIPIYLIGEKFISKYSGIFASLFFIFSNLSIFMAHESRIYSLLAFLTTLSVYFFLKSFSSKSKFLLGLTLTNVIILYSHYLGYWIIITEALLYFGFMLKYKKLSKPFLFHLSIIFLCFIPQLPILYQRFMDSGVNGTWIAKSTGIDTLYNMLWKFSNAPLVTVIVIIIFSFSLFKYIYKKGNNSYALRIQFLTWFPLLISFILSFKVGFFIEKYFYFISPLFYLSLSLSISFLLQKYSKIKYSTLIVFCLLMIFTFKISTKESRISGYHKNISNIASKINNKTNINTSFLISPSWFDKQIVYYLDPKLFSSYFLEYDQPSVFNKPLNLQNIKFINAYNHYNIPETKNIIYIDKDYNEGPNSIIDKIKASHYILTEISEISDVKFMIFTKSN